MKQLLRYLSPYRKEAVLGPLFKWIEASFELLIPLLVAAIVDHGIAEGNRSLIVSRAILMMLLGALGYLCSITAQYFAAKASVGFTTSIRDALFQKINTFSYADLDTLGQSTLLTRITGDCNQVQSGMNLALRLLLRSPFVVFGAMIMAFTVDAKSALLFAVMIPILLAVVFFILLVCIPGYKSVQAQLDTVTGATRENLNGTRVIRAFCREESEIQSFEEKANLLYRLQMRVGNRSSLLSPLTLAIVNLTTVLLVYIGAVRVDRGALSQGQVIALYNYMAQILVELIKLANLIITMTKAIACGNRIQTLLNQTPSMEENEAGSVPTDCTIVFDRVGFAYPGSKELSLHGISFTANPGETIGIIGGTGSGKSTLVSLIPRLYEASEGSITIGGRPLSEYSPAALRNFIGFVPQKALLFRGTIRENLLWGNPKADDGELEQALQMAQASSFVYALPQGLDAPVESFGRNFSGGQRQRLTVARALVRHAPILILDDSTSALDFATDAALRKAIRSLPQNPTVFLVSQRAATLTHCTRILVLEDGELVGSGSHEELLATCEAYREIYAATVPTGGDLS